jgi:hypothetical protein
VFEQRHFLCFHNVVNSERTCIYFGKLRVTEGKIQGGTEVTGRQGRTRRKLLDDLKDRRGYAHLK